MAAAAAALSWWRVAIRRRLWWSAAAGVGAVNLPTTSTSMVNLARVAELEQAPVRLPGAWGDLAAPAVPAATHPVVVVDYSVTGVELSGRTRVLR